MTPSLSSLNSWPADGLESVSACQLCGSSDRTPIFSGLRDYFFGCATGAWSLYRCESCKSGYLDPRPNQQTIGMAYSRYYTHQQPKIVSSKLRKIWHALRNDYLSASFGLKSAEVMWPGRWLIRLFPVLRQGIDTGLARNLEPLSGVQGKLLDVGCGNGNFLDFARRAGWQVRGLDFDPAAVAAARARELDVLEGTIALLDGERECYDRITLSHVLEHIYDPWETLASCHRLLKPGGVLWLETPNMNSNGQRIFGPHWRGLEPPRHLHLFSRKCLRDKIVKIGFSQVEDRFSSFATGAMWRDSRTIMVKAGAERRLGVGVLGWLFAEIKAMFFVESREFITMVCVKSR
jgi:2-polyprenyl-3-methyl-5-hydroxy-6-metoxy-1,4-benzoquinol methylase